MAKAHEISLNNADKDPQVWLAEVLRLRFTEVMKFRDAALDPEQINGVHDMRVAIRRLRSMIRDFSEITDKLAFKSLRKKLKSLADSLGAVRDADVFIESLQSFSPKSDEATIRTGIDHLLLESQAKRQAAHSELCEQLSDQCMEGLEDRFAGELSNALKRRHLFQVKSVRHAAKLIIGKCITEFQNQGDAIYFPLSSQRLHRMRISGKHFRYAVELFGGELGPWSERVVEEIGKFQGHVGKLHDYDVWTAKMRDSAIDTKASDGEKQASSWLIGEFQGERAKAYRKALEQWTKWETGAFWKDLDQQIG